MNGLEKPTTRKYQIEFDCEFSNDMTEDVTFLGVACYPVNGIWIMSYQLPLEAKIVKATWLRPIDPFTETKPSEMYVEKLKPSGKPASLRQA